MFRKLLPLLILTGLVLIFFARLFYPTSLIFMIPDFGESDVLHLNLPFKYILSQSLQNRQWPLWTPYLANGFPILAEGQIGTFYLPNLLFFRFLPLVWAYNLNLALSFLIASTGTYLFAKKIGLSKAASFFAALIFTFSGFLSVHLNHFNLIQTAALLPFIFWSTHLLWQKPRLKYSLLLAFIFSQQIFAGHFYITFITLLGITVYYISLLLSNPCKKSKRIIYFLLSFVSAFLLSAIQLLPTVELWQLSSRQGGLDFNAVTDYPYPAKHLITFVSPYFFGSPANGTYPTFNSDWGIFWENTAYIGLVPLFLSLLSIFFPKNKTAKTFLAISAVSMFLVLGKNSPFYFIFSFFPFSLFRVPSKYLLLTTFSLSILAAFSINRLLNRVKRPAVALICLGILFILIIADEYRFSYNYPPATPSGWWTSSPEVAKLIPEKSRIASPAAPFSWNKVFKKTGWQDFAPFIYFKNSLYPNYNALFSVGGADINTGGLIPRRVSLFSSLLKNIDVDEEKKEASAGSTMTNALNIAGVRYFVTSYKINSPSFELKDVLPPPKNSKLDPILLYENNDSLPRSYLSGNSRKIETVEDFNNILADENFVKTQTVLVEEDTLKLENPGKAVMPVNITFEKPAEIVLEAASGTPSVLVLADTNYPGWKAYMDGKPVEIHYVNLVQRAIYFPKGQHQVKFIFQPQSFELGKKITIFSWVIFSLAVFLYSSVFPRKVSGNKKLFPRYDSKPHSQ